MPALAVQWVPGIGGERRAIPSNNTASAAVGYLVGNKYDLSNNHNHVEEVNGNDKHHHAFPVIAARR